MARICIKLRSSVPDVECYVVRKSCKSLTMVQIINLCVLYGLAVFQGWNIFFLIANLLVLKHMFCCSKSLWIHSRSPPHLPHFLPPGGTCLPLALPSFPFFLAFDFWPLLLAWTLTAEQTLKKLVFCSSFKIMFMWGSVGVDIRSVVVLRWEVKSDNSAIWRYERYVQ